MTSSERPEILDVPATMRAVVLGEFGSADALRVGEVRTPDIGPSSVLVRVEAAGIGSWDPFEREGGYADTLGIEASFPYVLGSDGAGTVAAIGTEVDHVEVADVVFGSAFLNPTGGFYAAYAAVEAGLVAKTPVHLSVEQAGGLAGIGMTALRGLDDVLNVNSGNRLAIVGASGGIGHMAVQIAAARRVEVLAIASGADGVELCQHLGATIAIDGRHDDAAAALARFAPDGLDAALVLTGGDVSDAAIAALAPTGRAAFPTGVEVSSTRRAVMQFNGEPDADITRRLLATVNDSGIDVHVHATFDPDHIADAHTALGEHHLGKLILNTQPLHHHGQTGRTVDQGAADDGAEQV